MNLSNPRLLNGLARIVPGIACVAVGFCLGVMFRSAPREAGHLPSPLSADAAAPPEKPGRREATPAAVVSPLERLRALTSPRGHVQLAEAVLLIEQLQLGECQSALSLFKAVSNRNDREILLDSLAARWAHLDAADAFNNAQTSRRDNDWSNRIGFAAGAALAQTDPQAALDRISSARNNDLREKAAEWVLPALAKSHGLRAAEYLSSNSRLGRYPHIYEEVAQEFGRSSPLEAITWANSLSDKILRNQAAESAWKGWAEVDPKAVAAAMERDPQAGPDPNLISVVAHSWSQLDLDATLAWIKSIHDPNQRNSAYASIDFDPAQLTRDQARELLTSIDYRHPQNDFVEKIGQQMARENIDEAIAWAKTLPNEKGRSRLMDSILQEWTGSDPGAAASYITSQPDSKERSSNLAKVMNLWSQANPDAAYAFAQTLPPGGERETALGSVVEVMISDDPEKAVDLFKSLQSTEVVGRLAPRFMGSLVRSDPSYAIDLASKLPEDTQPEAYRSLIRTWAVIQPEQAGGWINTLSPGASRDSAIKAYVSVVDGRDPGLATKWAFSIQEPVERMESTFSAFNRWLQKDRTAARAWAAETAIPGGLRPFFDRLLNDEKFASDHR